MAIKQNIGKKYFKYDSTGAVKLYRVINVKDNNKIYIIRDEDDHKKIFRIQREELEKDFTLLSPAGMITISSVEVENMKDIIITIHKRNKSSYQLYAVCRQNVFDPYANMLKLANDNTTYVGASLSIDSCPKDIDFKLLIACKSIDYAEMISIYLDDNIDTILDLILKIKRFNQTLISIYNSVVSSPTSPIKGYCTDLKQLLSWTEFYKDFCSAFDIIHSDKYTIGEDCIMGEDYAKQLEDILNLNLTDIVLMRYYYDIDFDKINKEYSIISDASNNIYVASYISNGCKNESYKSINNKVELKYFKQFF